MFVTTGSEPKKILQIEDLPLWWRVVFGNIQGLDQNAILSGGSLRDLDHSLEPKDIDIFVTEKVPLKNLKELLNSNSGTDFESHPDYPSAVVAQSTGTVSGENVPVNLIVLKDGTLPNQRWREHDFGLCQIMFDGERIEATTAYVTDRENKTFTLERCADHNDFKRSYRRYRRFVEKYPAHSLVIKPELTSFVYE